MGIFDFLGSLFGPKEAVYNFACPRCGAECSSTATICEKCMLKISEIIARKCNKCGTLNKISAGRCSKCGYNLAADKNIRFVYVCPTCANEFDKYTAFCPVCGSPFE